MHKEEITHTDCVPRKMLCSLFFMVITGNKTRMANTKPGTLERLKLFDN